MKTKTEYVSNSGAKILIEVDSKEHDYFIKSENNNKAFSGRDIISLSKLLKDLYDNATMIT